MDLTKPRIALQEFLAGVTQDIDYPGDVPVVDHIPDQVAVPALMLTWGNPMVEHDTLCGQFLARFDVVFLAARFEPGGAYDTLEHMVSAVLPPVMESDAWEFVALTAPYPLELAGVVYLALRLTLTIDTEG